MTILKMCGHIASVIELDPYAAQVASSIFLAEEVPDG
jgi:hypothetical protein